MDSPAGDTDVRGAGLSLAGFWPRCASLLGVVAATLLCVGLAAWLRGGPDALTAAALSALVCAVSAIAALATAALFRSPDRALLQVLLGMLLRMGPPLILVLIVHHYGGRLADAGMVYYLLTFYLVTLIAEIPLSLSLPPAAGRRIAALRIIHAPMAEAEQGLDIPHLMGHVQDAEYFEVPRMMAPPKNKGKLFIPQPFESVGTIAELPSPFQPLDLRITKFMILEVVAAVIVAALFIWLGRKVAAGGAPRGRLWNMLEAMVVFIRDEVARPAIGRHDADKFLPLVWTVFFFVLICNLIGLVPWAGSATGSLATTAALALVTFAVVVLSGSVKLGPAGFWKSLVPHMDLPPAMMIFLWPMLFGIELLGLLIKHFVLAVRLFANMLAGHLVLAVIVAFIGVTAHSAMVFGVIPASVLGATALNLLELLVAFIQAYIFAFLTSLFIGTAVHPH